MTQLLDVFGFLSVVLRGLTLALQSLVVGGLVFGLLAGRSEFSVSQACDPRRLIGWTAALLALVQSGYLAANTAALLGTSDLRLFDVLGANFFLAGCAIVFLAALVALLQMRVARSFRIVALILSTGILAASVATSHSAARLHGRTPLILLDALHQAATATWIGGLPYLILSITRSADPEAVRLLSARFSRLAQASVGTLLAAGAGLSFIYIRKPSAILGTAYGAMVTTKVILFGLLLILGAFNFYIVKRLEAGDAGILLRLRRFAEAELGIGLTVILAAGSLTSQPPAADLASSQVPIAEIVQRLKPVWPRMSAPAPSQVYRNVVAQQPSAAFESFVPGQLASPITAEEIALSEFNHHWAGLFVLAAGILAIGARAGLKWARHWPWTFLVLGVFIFFMADADYWPLGQLPFWSGFAVSEVLQHRLILPLVVAFSWFEWRVQAGLSRSPREALVFPIVCAAGGAILVTHTHSLNNVKEELLAELSHIPIALMGVMAGWSRWLELRLPDGPKKVMSWIWPICFTLIGAWLLNYRES